MLSGGRVRREVWCGLVRSWVLVWLAVIAYLHVRGCKER